MPKTKISEYSVTNSSNTDIEGINIDEGCAPSGINNAIRELMVHLKEFQTGASGDAFTFAGGVLISGTANTITGNVLMSGTNTITGSTTATFAAGAVGTPSIAAHGDTNTGIFFPAADTIAFSEGGVESMRIDSSGNVGIGVTPSAWRTNAGDKALQMPGGAIRSVVDAIGVTQNAYFDSGGFKYYGTGSASYYEQYGGAHSWSTAGSGTAGNAITFTERMRIDSSGNVGIGTSSPAQKLHIIGTSSSGIRLDGGSSPAAILEMQADATASNGVVITATYNGGGSYGPIKFKTGGSEAMRITSGGNFLVGTTTVNPHSTGTYGSQLSVGGALIGVNNSHAIIAARWNGDGEVIRLQRDNTDVGSIDVTTTATSYNTTSDYRLKESIQPMTGALEKVAQLKPCTYTWKSDGSVGQGFIAHELQEVVPDCVTGEKDAIEVQQYEITPAVYEDVVIPAILDEEGNQVEPERTEKRLVSEAVMGERKVPVYQGVDTSFLVATLTAAIQELKAELDATKAEVAAMKAGNGN